MIFSRKIIISHHLLANYVLEPSNGAQRAQTQVQRCCSWTAQSAFPKAACTFLCLSWCSAETNSYWQFLCYQSTLKKIWNALHITFLRSLFRLFPLPFNFYNGWNNLIICWCSVFVFCYNFPPFCPFHWNVELRHFRKPYKGQSLFFFKNSNDKKNSWRTWLICILRLHKNCQKNEKQWAALFNLNIYVKKEVLAKCDI